MRWRGNSANGLGLRPLVYVEAAAVMWGSCLAEDVRDGKKKYVRVSRECYEDCMGAE